MRLEKGLWILLFFFMLASCEKKVALFEEPQPQNVKSLKGFPKKFAGTYLSLKDSSQLQISAGMLIRSLDGNFKIHPNELDSTEIIKNGILIDIETGEKFTAVKDGDSIRIFKQFIDTIFDITNQDILKKYKGHYLLNLKYEDGYWDVMDLIYRSGRISLKHISEKAEMEKLKTISELQEDSTRIFRPTRKQFKAFMKQNGFNDEELFIRIK